LSTALAVLLGLGIALSLSLVGAAPAGAGCTYPTVFSAKGTLSGTFYDTAGTLTKVKCDVSAERGAFLLLDWTGCPGISTFGGSPEPAR
jgi:hypothetical protein